MPSRKSNDIAPWVELALRLALGGYFAWSGWEKVFHTGLAEFTRAVGNYKIVYSPWDAVVAYTIPWSNLVEGNQKLVPDLSKLTHGQSVTDACIGWDDTVAVLDRFAAAVRARRAL